jgi:hypothetical protein
MSSAGDEARLQNARETIDCMSPSLAMNRVGTNETALHDLSQLLQTGTILHI